MRSFTRHGALLLLALGALSLGCAAPAEDDVDDGADAVTLARGDLAPMVEKARKVADALGTAGYRAGAPSALLVPGEIPSATFTGWKVAGIVDADRTFLGYMLLPRAKAPAGAFGVVLVDPRSKIVALSAYVPDRAPDAEKTAGAILDALARDGAALEPKGGAVKTQGIATKIAEEGVELAMRLLSGLSRSKGLSKAGQGAEAFLAPKVDSAVWGAFTAMVGDRAAVGKVLSEIASHRIAFGSRRVIAVEVSESGGRSSGKVLDLLARRYGSETKRVGLALRDTGDNAEAIIWALRNDVPIVLSSMHGTAAEAVENAVRAMSGGTPEGYQLYVELATLARDPKKLALVRVITADRTGIPLVHQEFAAVWTMSDEALGVSFAGRAESELLPFFQRFELRTSATLP